MEIKHTQSRSGGTTKSPETPATKIKVAAGQPFQSPPNSRLRSYVPNGTPPPDHQQAGIKQADQRATGLAGSSQRVGLVLLASNQWVMGGLICCRCAAGCSQVRLTILVRNIM